MTDVLLTRDALSSGLSTYSADHDLASSVLLQSADEIDLISTALESAVYSEELVRSGLTAIAMRVRFAAEISSKQEEPAELVKPAYAQTPAERDLEVLMQASAQRKQSST